MRKFYIKGDDETKSLQTNDLFFVLPDGLGFQNNISFEENEGFYFPTSIRTTQVNKSGKLVFKGVNPYEDYKKLITWINRQKKLTLVYVPEELEYCIDILIVSIGKSEKTKIGTLEAPIVLAPVTPWYSMETVEFTASGASQESIKEYTYTYPYEYTATTTHGVIYVQSASDAQMPCAFTFELLATAGTLVSPKLTAMLGGEIPLGKVDLTGYTLAAGKKIRYSSKPGESFILADTTDLTGELRLAANVPTFFMLPPAETARFTFSASVLTNMQAKINVFSYFRSV